MNFKCYPWYQYTSLKSNKYFSKIPNFRGILDPLLGKTFLDTWIKQNSRVQSLSVKPEVYACLKSYRKLIDSKLQ